MPIGGPIPTPIDRRREAPYLDLIQDCKTGDAVKLEDTLFNRAWIAAGMEFTDEAKRVSFYWRVEQVIGLAVAPE